MKNLAIPTALALCLAALVLPGCGSTTPTEAEKPAFDAEVQAAIHEFKTEDPEIKKFFDSAHGYAVFPSVGKGAIGVGGAHGRGYVYKKGEHTGYTRLTQATIGLQLGGQSYREVIFFENEKNYVDFVGGNFEFAAQVSAVAAKAGASADANYADGVLVFTMAQGGLMYEASVGGQKFDFQAK
jgi:lipid-binding SYLF domain-containing protein